MIVLRWMAVWMILMEVGATSLHALNPTDGSIHSDHLWQLASQEQATLEQSGSILNDTSLSSYLDAVARRLWEEVDTDLKAPVIEVLMETGMDAYTYPNGFVVLSTGLLNHIKNEDQLAMILAHEMIHYARQHTTEVYDHFQVGDHRSGSPDADPGQVPNMADMQQAIDAAEYQADLEGLSILKGAGYCEAEVLDLMTELMESIQAQGKPNAWKAIAERKMRIQAQINPAGSTPSCPSATDDGRDRFLAAATPALMANAQTALRRGEWNLAENCLSKYMALKPGDARVYYLQGEILRRRDDGDPNNRCIGLYEEALKIDPDFPSVHRALGELHFKAGEYRLAKPYFEAFLSLAPQDEASEYIKGYLSLCQ